MIWTLSCSTSLRVALTATSGLASDDALMISIFLPATMPLRSFTASSAPRMPSCPPAANGPSSVASRPILIVSCAWRRPRSDGRDRDSRQPRRATSSYAASLVSSFDAMGGPPAALVERLLNATHCRVGSRGAAASSGRVSPLAELCPTSRAGRRARTARSPGTRADHQVEALAVDQVDGEVLQQHEHHRADERPDRDGACRPARR